MLSKYESGYSWWPFAGGPLVKKNQYHYRILHIEANGDSTSVSSLSPLKFLEYTICNNLVSGPMSPFKYFTQIETVSYSLWIRRFFPVPWLFAAKRQKVIVRVNGRERGWKFDIVAKCPHLRARSRAPTRPPKSYHHQIPYLSWYHSIWYFTMRL